MIIAGEVMTICGVKHYILLVLVFLDGIECIGNIVITVADCGQVMTKSQYILGPVCTSECAAYSTKNAPIGISA